MRHMWLSEERENSISFEMHEGPTKHQTKS